MAQTKRDARRPVVDLAPRRALGTPAEVAEALGITVGALAQMRYAGNGPTFTVVGSRTVRYAWEDVDDWLARRKFDRTGRPLAASAR